MLIKSFSVAQLDADVEKHVDVIATDFFDGKRSLNIEDILLNKAVAASIAQEKVIIPRWDATRVLAAVPLNEVVYVELCPRCQKIDEFSTLKPFLERKAVIPVLLAPYGDFPEPFVRNLIKYPHISTYEYHFTRNIVLSSLHEGGLCSHCVGERKTRTLGLLGEAKGSLSGKIEEIYGLLVPHVRPDFELFDAADELAVKNDAHALGQLASLSRAVHMLRTAEAFCARPDLPADRLVEIPRQLLGENRATLFAEDIRRSIAEGLELVIPEDKGLEHYLDVAVAERQKIARAVSKVAARAKGSDGQISLAKVRNLIGSLNEEILSRSASTRYLLYRASLEFASENKALVFSTLVAGAMGLTGNLLGCGAASAAAIGSRMLKGKLPQLKGGKSVSALVRQIHRDLDPVVNVALAKYLTMSVEAFQIWQIRERINASEVSFPANSRNVSARPVTVKKTTKKRISRVSA